MDYSRERVRVMVSTEGVTINKKNPRMLEPGDKACITNKNFLLNHHKGGFFQRYLGRVKSIVAF
ncbi:hypothetical protein DQ657_24495 [Salmonella enterica]|nr:hypothetical protein [Salmonella enterica]